MVGQRLRGRRVGGCGSAAAITGAAAVAGDGAIAGASARRQHVPRELLVDGVNGAARATGRQLSMAPVGHGEMHAMQALQIVGVDDVVARSRA